MYAKLTDGVVEVAPKNKGKICNYNLDVTAMLADGYKPLIETAKPDGAYTLSYEDTTDGILQVWTLVVPPEPTAEDLAAQEAARVEAEKEALRRAWIDSQIETAETPIGAAFRAVEGITLAEARTKRAALETLETGISGATKG